MRHYQTANYSLLSTVVCGVSDEEDDLHIYMIKFMQVGGNFPSRRQKVGVLERLNIP